MTVSAVAATRIVCDLTPDERPCGSRILGDNPSLTEEAVRAAAAERGWSVAPDGGDRCPKHRGEVAG